MAKRARKQLTPKQTIGLGFLLMGLAIVQDVFITGAEHSGGTVMMPVILTSVYDTVGPGGMAVIMVALGLFCIILGAVEMRVAKTKALAALGVTGSAESRR